MATKDKVVIGESVTARQLRELFRLIDIGAIGSKKMQYILEHHKEFAAQTLPARESLPTTELIAQQAMGILGPDKVIPGDVSAQVWNIECPSVFRLYYTLSTLHECAESNRKNGTDFRLVYIHGFSLPELRERVGTDAHYPPNFYRASSWLKRYQPQCTKPPGYVLIDFNGRYGGMPWHVQEQEIAQKDNYTRAHEDQIAEALLTIFKISGVRLLNNWLHWGYSLVGYDHITIGPFDARGLRVDSALDYDESRRSVWDDNSLRVCLFRKYDI